MNGAADAWSYGAGLIESRRSLSHAPAATRLFGRPEDTYFWLMRDLGGQEIEARMLFDRQDSDLAALAWLQHLQAQASARLEWGRLELVPAYAFDRFDDRPSAGIHQRRQTGLLEARVPLDAARRLKLTAFAEHDYTTRTVSSREADHHREALELVGKAVAELPSDFRAALLLRVEEGLSFREVAKVLGTTEETARWRVFKARQKLMKVLAPELLPPGATTGEGAA